MVLTKSSKPIPVMLVGIIFYNRKFPWYKYVSVLLVCAGIGLFSSGKKDSAAVTTSAKDASDGWSGVIGIGLVLLNLLLDGYTNNEQDEIFEKHKISPLKMMANTNAWQLIFILVYLVGTYYLYGDQSELFGALHIITESPALRTDVLLFCLCAVLGQVLIFSVMKEFGSLVWITISITRKLFTILLSIFMFSHPVVAVQWTGIALVFAGLVLESAMSYRKKLAADGENGSKKKED